MHTLSLEAVSGGWPLGVACFLSRRLRKRWTPLMSCQVASLAVSLLLHARAGYCFADRKVLFAVRKQVTTDHGAPGLEGLLSCQSARQLNRRLQCRLR